MEALLIPAHEIGPDVRRYKWHVGKELFECFGNSEVIDADLDVDAEVSGTDAVSVRGSVRGSVTVRCDRCLGDLVLPVDCHFGDEGEYSVVGAFLDLRQDLYDCVCTSLPLRRVHGEGQCDPEVVKFLRY